MVLRTLGTAVLTTVAMTAALALPGPAVAAAPSGALVQVGTTDPAVAYGDGEWGWTSSSGTEMPWVSPDNVALFTDASGDLGVASYAAGTGRLAVQSWDPSTLSAVAGSARSIDLGAWPIWGGLYAAPTGDFYVAAGRVNTGESDSFRAVAVMRFDAAWNLVGTAYVTGGATQGFKGIYEPFEAGRAAMTLVGDRLVLHMGRTMYAIDGVHHQAGLTVEIATSTMTATPFQQLGGYAYSSHSFNQFVTAYGGSLVVVDHGDAYPRSVQMGTMAGYPARREVATTDLLSITGQAGNNYTGVAVGGVVPTESGILVAASSVDQDAAAGQSFNDDHDHQARNAVVIAADPATGSHTTTRLTSYSPTGDTTARAGRIARVAANRYAVVGSVRSGSSVATHYWLLDDHGTLLAHRSFTGLFFSDTTELHLLGSTLFWVGVARPAPGDGSSVPAYLFSLDVTAPEDPLLAGAGGAVVDVADPGGAGGSAPATATPSTPAAPATLVATKAPTLTGKRKAGRTLRVTPGAWTTRVTVTYQWLSGSKPLAGRTGSRLKVTRALARKAIRVRVTVSAPGYTTVTRVLAAKRR
ncbi:MAG: hypothetical protein QM572_02625 [Nocardioides sp.]|uniref:hypothetical protein n=1 Tax=Nocardioides sp. TaxID=35761 RepID=UPI0039E448C3